MKRELRLGGIGSFVGRDGEIESFTSDLGRVVDGSKLNANVREYYGPPGIGKSELLHQFVAIANLATVPHAVIDFAEVKMDAVENDPSVLFDKFVNSLSSVTDTRGYVTTRQAYMEIKKPGDVVAAYAKIDQETRLYQRPEWLDAMRSQAVEMIKVANQLGKDRKPQLLIFDNVQHVGVEAVDFIEEWMVNPLTQVPGLLAVWADKRPWRWKRPEIRRRLSSNELRPLSNVEVGLWVETVTQAVAPAKIAQLHKITGGNPGALQTLAKGGYI